MTVFQKILKSSSWIWQPDTMSLFTGTYQEQRLQDWSSLLCRLQDANKDNSKQVPQSDNNSRKFLKRKTIITLALFITLQIPWSPNTFQFIITNNIVPEFKGLSGLYSIWTHASFNLSEIYKFRTLGTPDYKQVIINNKNHIYNYKLDAVEVINQYACLK